MDAVTSSPNAFKGMNEQEAKARIKEALTVDTTKEVTGTKADKVEAPIIVNMKPGKQLNQLAQLADDARMGNITEAEAEWVLISCGPLVRELQTRRAVMARAGLPVDTANVVVIGQVR
jgi:hypothetical protein